MNVNVKRRATCIVAQCARIRRYVVQASCLDLYYATKCAAILAQEPFPVRTCKVFFPFTSPPGVALSKCLQTSFVVSHLFSKHVRAMERMCLFSLLPASCSNVVLLTALFLTSKGTRYRANTMHQKINEMFVQVSRLQLLILSVSRFEDFVQTLSQRVAS